ncbi:hypothetical protein F4775DRAFT_549683 [Biscogniauxia sp. FL1348]|nr:hypothetical protein F4775DRAFT_549683 [Biscogniauxia sp. FL1348]
MQCSPRRSPIHHHVCSLPRLSTAASHRYHAALRLRRAVVHPDTSELIHEIDPCPSSRRRQHHLPSLGAPGSHITLMSINPIQACRLRPEIPSRTLLFDVILLLLSPCCLVRSHSLTCDSALVIYEIPWSSVDHMGPETRDQRPESRIQNREIQYDVHDLPTYLPAYLLYLLCTIPAPYQLQSENRENKTDEIAIGNMSDSTMITVGLFLFYSRCPVNGILLKSSNGSG